MTITLTETGRRNGYHVQITDPTHAILAMAGRMNADPSNMVDGWVEKDGSVHLEARGARGGQLYGWASKAAKAVPAAHAPHKTTSGRAFCRRCGGPTSVYGQPCDSCSGDA